MPRLASRSARWSAAISAAQDAVQRANDIIQGDLESALSDLRDVQQEYIDWRDNLPENLQQSALGEKLEAVCDLELEPDTSSLLQEIDDALGEAEGIDLPLGFGRD